MKRKVKQPRIQLAAGRIEMNRTNPVLSLVLDSMEGLKRHLK